MPDLTFNAMNNIIRSLFFIYVIFKDPKIKKKINVILNKRTAELNSLPLNKEYINVKKQFFLDFYEFINRLLLDLDPINNNIICDINNYCDGINSIRESINDTLYCFELNKINNILSSKLKPYLYGNSFEFELPYNVHKNYQPIIQIFMMYVHMKMIETKTIKNVTYIEQTGPLEDSLYLFGLSIEQNWVNELVYLDDILSEILYNGEHKNSSNNRLLELYKFVDWYLTYKAHKQFRSIDEVKRRFSQTIEKLRSNRSLDNNVNISETKNITYLDTKNMYYNYGYVMTLFYKITHSKYNCYLSNDIRISSDSINLKIKIY